MNEISQHWRRATANLGRRKRKSNQQDVGSIAAQSVKTQVNSTRCTQLARLNCSIAAQSIACYMISNMAKYIAQELKQRRRKRATDA